jgi:hypothetical protein
LHVQAQPYGWKVARPNPFQWNRSLNSRESGKLSKLYRQLQGQLWNTPHSTKDKEETPFILTNHHPQRSYGAPAYFIIFLSHRQRFPGWTCHTS